MSRRRELEDHRRKLNEIREIMNSMKTLAYMETRRLARFIDAQHAVVTSLEAVAADFLHHYPQVLAGRGQAIPVYLLLGSERGFCGDFNERLLLDLDASLGEDSQPLLLAMGHKLYSVLTAQGREVIALDGASVVEEVETVLGRLVDTLAEQQSRHGLLDLYVLYHGGEETGSLMQQLLPPFQSTSASVQISGHPPLLNETPTDFFAGLTDNYLFAALHAMLYTSLMAENRRRVEHLEGAVNHMEEKAAQLLSQSNALRQEEIIEEIEVILLSADLMGGP